MNTKVASWAMLGLAACFSPPAPVDPCNATNTCPDGGTVDASPLDSDAVADTSVDAAPDACVPQCVGELLDACTGTLQVCAFGCLESGGAHCALPTPSNGVPLTLLDDLPADAPDIVWDQATIRIDSDTGEINGTGDDDRNPGQGYDAESGVSFRTHVLSDGRTAGVFILRSLLTNTDVEIRGAQPVIFLVEGDVQAMGELELINDCARTSCPGPGGGRGGSEATAPVNTCSQAGTMVAENGLFDNVDSHDGGGGGGGNATPGGFGGGFSDVNGAPGSACDGFEPLAGGGGGGFGSDQQASTGFGGGGGGAIQLTALGDVTIDDRILASGYGGRGGTNVGAGSGGGAGGTVLIEGATVMFRGTGTIYANGGAGGGGGGGNAYGPGLPGEAGQFFTLMADGGFEGGPNGAPGGDGGTEFQDPDDGFDDFNAGGGGGAVGRARLRAVSGPPNPPGGASPMPDLATWPVE